MRKCSILFLLCLLLAGCAFAADPVIFYTDLTSGPNSGGENNKGAYVSIYGRNFGATQGASKVTVGCGDVDNYKVWTDTKIVVQLGVQAKTGDIVVKVGGVLSNALPFTVRAGNILFVSTTGNDSTADGSIAKPYATVTKAKTKMSPGDTLYFRAGTYTAADNFKAVIATNKAGGSAALPYAFIAYPGETVTLGQDTSSTPTNVSILSPGVGGGPFSGYVFANFNLRGWDSGVAFKIGTAGQNFDWRIVGNDFQCQNGNTAGGAACMDSSSVTNIAILGNNIHDVSTALPSASVTKLYHAVYLSTNTNSIDFGWNTVANVNACRGFQTHSTSGSDQHDIMFHDNVFHDVRCDCVNFDTVNPNAGPVMGWNNITYNCGTGPDFGSEGASDYACLFSPANTDNNEDANRGGNILWFNNIMYNCGIGGTGTKAAISVKQQPTPVGIVLTNNIILQNLGQAYLVDPANTTSGSNNIWFGNGLPPAGFLGDLNLDPLLSAVGSADFHLLALSPAKDAGKVTTAVRDRDGVMRPQGAAFDIGAFELPVASNKSPAAPKNAAGSVQ